MSTTHFDGNPNIYVDISFYSKSFFKGVVKNKELPELLFRLGYVLNKKLYGRGRLRLFKALLIKRF